MQIVHIAIWSENIEKLKDFYIEYFDCSAGEKYLNPKTGFESYFLVFDGEMRLELMQKPGIAKCVDIDRGLRSGLAHIAISAGSRGCVDALTERLRSAGFRVVSEPRMTGDGYYESCVLDPECNRVEITGFTSCRLNCVKEFIKRLFLHCRCVL